MPRPQIDKYEAVKTRISVQDNGCWNWVGDVSSSGYGKISSGYKTFWAHRISYELFVGELSPGLVIDHKCRNRACVNPDHLELVTQKENVMRGIGVASINSRKTHCINGHALIGDNLYTYKRVEGLKRECKICRSNSVRRMFGRKEVCFA